jgi:hypothetical protein
MSLYDFLVIFHLLLFVYWLGGDLGVFYSSGMVVDTELSNSARVTAAKIMINLDFVPRICMTLMLTVGGLLTGEIGIEHPLWQTIGFIALGPGWLAMVLYLHYAHGTELSKIVTKIDYYFRWVLVVYLICSVTFYTFFSDRLATAPWVSAKLGVFALLVFCGLMIRKFIPGYIQGIMALRNDVDKMSISDEMNATMTKSLDKCRPFVLAIWAGLLVECYLGVAQPGDQPRVMEVFGALTTLGGL